MLDKESRTFVNTEGDLVTESEVQKVTPSTNLIPSEILKMDKRSIELYRQVLREGQEAVHSIRVMVVGPYGAGKTTLTKRLFSEYVDINKRESTNGIDVHVRKCQVSLQNGDWDILYKGQKTINARLVKLFNLTAIEGVPGDEDEHVDTLDEDITSDDISLNDISDEEFKFEYDSTELKFTYGDDNPDPEINRLNADTVPTDAATGVNSLLEKSSAGDPTEEYIRNQLKGLMDDQEVTGDRGANKADLSVWDFAGQYVFYATHQVFLSRRAVYLLVTDISKHVSDIVQDDDCFPDSNGLKSWKISDFIEFWLKSIHEFCSTPDDVSPPVILVGTFADKLHREKKEDISDEFFYTIRKSLVDKATYCHLTDEDFAIDNSIVDSNIENLRKHIFKVASKQTYWGELIPVKWITLENSIDDLKEKGEKVLRVSRFRDLNLQLPVPLESEEELDLFLRFHHESGNILYYSDENLNDSIVLDPQWLIDAFKSLITVKMFCCRKQNIFKKWIQFDQSAILTHELVDAVWEKDGYSMFHEHKELLLIYLEKLGFIAKPRQQSASTECAHTQLEAHVENLRQHVRQTQCPVQPFYSGHRRG